jgi:hypothetical protein
VSNALLLRMEGKSPAIEVALDIARRGVIAVVVAAGLGWFFWGTDGAISVFYAGAVVLVNFVLAGVLLGWGGRVSFAMMAAAAMFGFFLRLGLMFAAVLLVKDAGWFEPVPLGITLVVTHLGLLLWELRYVSGSLAYPGLKPKPKASASRASERAV